MNRFTLTILMTFKKALLAALLAMLSGCAPAPLVDYGPPPPRWVKGNVHTHSLWSDGTDFPEVVISWYKENGYDFLAVSDHNTIADGEKWVEPAGKPSGAAALDAYLARFGEDWVEQREENGRMRVRLKPFEEYRSLLETPGRFLLIRSEEISDRFEKKPLHVNAHNLDTLIAPQGGGSVRDVLQNNIDAALEHGRTAGRSVLAHVNHPNFGWAVTAEDLIGLEGERFFEVYNGHPLVHNEGDALHPSTERLWDIVLTRRLTEGRGLLYGLATDDAHNFRRMDSTTSNPGRGWIVVRTGPLTAEAIIGAMDMGDFYASTGVTLKEISVAPDALRLSIWPEPGVGYHTEFIGTRKGYDARSEALTDPEGLPVTRRYSDEMGEVLAEASGPNPSYRFTGDELYVRARIRSSKPKANGIRHDERETAWTQPVSPDSVAQAVRRR